jgi:hypothetical protein
MRAISCTSVCASRHPVFAERSWDSLARRHGCVETCAFLGRSEGTIVYVCTSRSSGVRGSALVGVVVVLMCTYVDP